MRFSSPITLTRMALIRDLFSYGFPRKLLAGSTGHMIIVHMYMVGQCSHYAVYI